MKLGHLYSDACFECDFDEGAVGITCVSCDESILTCSKCAVDVECSTCNRTFCRDCREFDTGWRCRTCAPTCSTCGRASNMHFRVERCSQCSKMVCIDCTASDCSIHDDDAQLRCETHFEEECAERKLMLIKSLAKEDLEFREDSYLCELFVTGCCVRFRGWTLERVVRRMGELRYLSEVWKVAPRNGESTMMMEFDAIFKHGNYPKVFPWVLEKRAREKKAHAAAQDAVVRTVVRHVTGIEISTYIQ